MSTSERRLHIGGEIPDENWEILNIAPAPYVDHEGTALDLSRFEDNTFVELYSSYVFQYFDFAVQLDAFLPECLRILTPGGRINVSVPNTDIIARLYMQRNRLPIEEQLEIVQLLFGKQLNPNDYHKIGFTPEFLPAYLERAGFVNTKMVRDFGYFNDSSQLKFKEVPISLNMIASKPN